MKRGDTTPPPLAVSRKDAAKMLGISLATLERYIKQNRVPAFKLNRRVLIRVSELEKVMEENRITNG